MENKNDKLDILRHSTAHILAAAVQDMFPEAKFGIGPTIEDGFYYDFDLPRTLIPEDLPLLEEKMRATIKQNPAFERSEISVKKAQELFKKAKQPYKVELIKDLVKNEKVKNVSLYKAGKFVDLCRGPHIDSAGEIKSDAFKLLKIAGAYWRGSEKNKMLQRIYGTAFENKNDLESYLKKLEEATKRDHRKLGKDLDLFSIDDSVGAGLILWHPKLSIVREEIELYWRQEHRKKGYQYLYTPHIGLSKLWETSGHLDFFKEGMYPPMSMGLKDKKEQGAYYVKPMSCPFHIKIYKSRPRSYRELPIRWCELGTVYRYEESGVLHGLLRVRGFTQDDAHIICREDQFIEEVNNVLDFAIEMNKVFGFDKLNVYLSIRDPKNKEKYVGEDKIWNFAETTLKKILVQRNIQYKEDLGGAKFYGPAIDLKAVDALGREWQGTTIQLDFNQPHRFDMTYIDKEGKEQKPVMLHRTLLGAMERFVGTLIEHCAGAFPVWLAPEQVWILPIGSRHEEYASKVAEALKKDNIRVVVKNENETIGKKIREGELQKIPYLLVVGDKEITADSVAVRERGKGDLGAMKLKEFIEKISKEIKEKI